MNTLYSSAGIQESFSDNDAAEGSSFRFHDDRVGHGKTAGLVSVTSHWVRWARLIGLSVAVTAGPIVTSDYILQHHALSIAHQEARTIAYTYLDRAEQAITEAMVVLGKLKQDKRADCQLDNRQEFGLAAFRSRYVSQIGIADTGGELLCGEPMGALALPARLPVADRGDPSVMISILSDGKTNRQATVTMRLDDRFRLVARLSQGVLDFPPSFGYYANSADIGVYLEDGSEWLNIRPKSAKPADTDAFTEVASSERLPLRVSVTIARQVALKQVSDLTTLVVIFSVLLGLFVFVLLLWTNWRRGDGDIFSKAVANNEFVPYYQPVFDLITGEIRGCEVLVRWQRPDGTMVPPGQFLPYAEATGLIRDITRQLMAQTVIDCSDIYDNNPQLKLSINLTAMHFNDLEIMEDIKRIFGGKIRFEQLCFEVTEQNPLKDLVLSRAIIGRIQALGASVALDDFGTGHGGLAYLQKLGVDIIKIDKMFVDNIGTDHSSQTIVDTLVELGHQLGLGIIAEGVERTDQVEHLKSIGVTWAQGYIYSPPIPAPAFREFALKCLAAEKSGLSPKTDKPVEVADSFAALTVDVETPDQTAA